MNGNVHYARALENGIDFAHGAWVHGGCIWQSRDEPEIQDYEVDYLGELSAVRQQLSHLNHNPSKDYGVRLYYKDT